ncbi:MAG: hypothetical protein GF383_09615 [Candidatus Lokiarchaeota archaeon]|nr:hypothetical protein [Candidatus Lokiarchaeota archaeon]MBD3340770.1 hypothetical protein [Candidatus Lokiarchaeota archaeon]
MLQLAALQAVSLTTRLRTLIWNDKGYTLALARFVFCVYCNYTYYIKKPPLLIYLDLIKD